MNITENVSNKNKMRKCIEDAENYSGSIGCGTCKLTNVCNFQNITISDPLRSNSLNEGAISFMNDILGYNLSRLIGDGEEFDAKTFHTFVCIPNQNREENEFCVWLNRLTTKQKEFLTDAHINPRQVYDSTTTNKEKMRFGDIRKKFKNLGVPEFEWTEEKNKCTYRDGEFRKNDIVMHLCHSCNEFKTKGEFDGSYILGNVVCRECHPNTRVSERGNTHASVGGCHVRR